jgi:hypothetical protein
MSANHISWLGHDRRCTVALRVEESLSVYARAGFSHKRWSSPTDTASLFSVHHSLGTGDV